MKTGKPLIRVLSVFSTITIVVSGAVVAIYLLLLGWGWLLRIKWVSDQTRQLSKRGNRYLRKIAGTRVGMLYFNLSALHHVGRRSGRPYMTPLSAYPLGDGFVLSLAYPRADWCENVLAAGRCALTRNGKTYELEYPQVIAPAEAMKAYPLLVRPFVAAQAPATQKFIWLHRSNSREQPTV